MKELMVEFIRLCNGTIGNLLSKVDKTDDGIVLVFTEQINLPHISIVDDYTEGTLYTYYIMVMVCADSETVIIMQSKNLNEPLDIIYEKPISQTTAKELHSEVCKALFYTIK